MQDSATLCWGGHLATSHQSQSDFIIATPAIMLSVRPATRPWSIHFQVYWLLISRPSKRYSRIRVAPVAVAGASGLDGVIDGHALLGSASAAVFFVEVERFFKRRVSAVPRGRHRPDAPTANRRQWSEGMPHRGRVFAQLIRVLVRTRIR
jgi:hypothetical protein